jgi:hypothetical protein
MSIQLVITDPTAATPTEIDTELVRLGRERDHAEHDLLGLRRILRYGDANGAQRLRSLVRDAQQRISDCDDAVRPLHEEFVRRGGWTRAFLVTNTGGHVHRTMDCRTCFPTTQFC